MVPEDELSGGEDHGVEDDVPEEPKTGPEKREDSPLREDLPAKAIPTGMDPVWEQDPLGSIIQSLTKYKEHSYVERGMMQELCNMLGGISLTKVLDRVKGLIHEVQERAERSEVEKLTGQVIALRRELQQAQAEKEEERRLSTQARNTLGEIREFITHPGEVINKAMLFDKKVLEAGKMVGPQLLTALVEYNKKMEATLEQLGGVMVEVKANTVLNLKP